MAWWAWVLTAWAVVGGTTVVWFGRALAEAEEAGRGRGTRNCVTCPHDQDAHPGGARCSLCPCPRWTAARHPDHGSAPVVVLLWTAAVILVVAGVATILQGGIALGILLLVVGLLVGPTGASIFS